MDIKKFEQMVKEAHEQYKDDPDMMEILEAMERDITEKSWNKGTLLTLYHLEER